MARRARFSEPMAQADFFAPFSGATASWRFCSRAVSALRLPGTLAAGTHRKSNRPFTPAKQNAAKPPARRIFRRTFRPPGKIRLKPTKPDACRQAEPPPPLRLRRPLSDGNLGAELVASRRRSPAGTGPQYGQVLYAASSVRKRASAFGHILRLFDRPKTAHAQRRMPPPKMQDRFLRHSSAPEGRSTIGLKTAALNELHPKTIRENAETEYRPNARFLNRHSGPIAKKAAALSHRPNFYPARRYHRPYGAHFRTGAFENDPSAPAFTRLCAMHPATALTPACRQRHRAHFSAHLPGIRSGRESCSGGRVYQRAPFGAHLCGSIADAAAQFKNNAYQSAKYAHDAHLKLQPIMHIIP